LTGPKFYFTLAVEFKNKSVMQLTKQQYTVNRKRIVQIKHRLFSENLTPDEFTELIAEQTRLRNQNKQIEQKICNLVK
jgi:hypothetical protein